MKNPPWLEMLLTDPRVTDICINGSQSCYVDRGNGMEAFSFDWSDEEQRAWVLEKISGAGKTWDARHPFVDAALDSGHRLHVAFPPLARNGVLVSLRRIARSRRNIGITPEHPPRWSHSPFFPTLIEAVAQGESVLISGSTGSGKTTLATDLLESVPLHERIIALEDTPELAPSHPHFLSLVSRPPNADGHGEVTLRMLMKQTLRMRPDRIVLGECRGAEVLDLLQLLNTGHRGAMATLHSNSPRDALRRVELLCLLAGAGTIPIPAIRELLATGIQWIVQLKRMGGERLISELWRVEGREGDTILLRPMVQRVG